MNFIKIFIACFLFFSCSKVGELGPGLEETSDTHQNTGSIPNSNPALDSNKFNFSSTLLFKSHLQDKKSKTLIYLHGDGASEYNDTFFVHLSELADSLNFHAFMVRAPDSMLLANIDDGLISMSVSWRTNSLNAADKLDSLIRFELFDNYAIYHDSVYFISASGGSIFLTSHFIPRHIKNYGGAAYLFCGGGKNLVNTQTSAILDYDFGLNYFTQKGDTVYNDVLLSANQYEEAGFAVNKYFFDGEGHCNFEILDELETLLTNDSLLLGQ